MTDKAIIMDGPSVRALLKGRKTQHRVVLKPQPPGWCYADQEPGYSYLTPKGHIEFRGRFIDAAGDDHGPASKFIKLPYAIGDRLWVREGCLITRAGDEGAPDAEPPVWYLADGDCPTPDNYSFRRPSTQMPRWASRLTLLVTDVRVQRLQEVSEADATAEGAPGLEWGDERDFGGTPHYRAGFRELWNSLNAARGSGWDANPWVCAITFKAIGENIDEVTV